MSRVCNFIANLFHNLPGGLCSLFDQLISADWCLGPGHANCSGPRLYGMRGPQCHECCQSQFPLISNSMNRNLHFVSKVKHEMSTEIAFYWHFMMERGAILISYTRLYFKARSVWRMFPGLFFVYNLSLVRCGLRSLVNCDNPAPPDWSP